MENLKSLNETKKKLALIFAIVVFCIAFLLEFTYLSFRYYSIYNQEKKEFIKTSEIFLSEVKINENIIDFLLNRENRLFRGKEWMIKPNLWPLRFSNFLILDDGWNIINWNIWQDINISSILKQNLEYFKIKTNNWTFLLKLPLRWVIWNEIIFIKKQVYPSSNYLSDIIYFNLFNLFFWILFYFIWLSFVNKNLKPVEENIKDMDDFIHNASHELKTPLSIINSNLQLMKKLKAYEEDLVDNSIKEIKLTDKLIIWLTNLSNINLLEERKSFYVYEKINEIVCEFQNEIDKKNIIIKINKIKDFEINANQEYFYIMFSNLLRNAIKYNHIKNWKINIEINKCKLLISNTWETIKKEDLSKIFDRLYKWEKSRNTEGFWIWLSLVKKICNIYNWEIKCESVDWITEFEIRF